VNTTDTAQRAHEAATKAQEVAVQVRDQAKTLVDDARSSDFASTATEVAHQVVGKARDLANDVASEVAVRTGRSKPSRLRRFGTSFRNHPIRWTLGLGVVGGATYSMLQKNRQPTGPTQPSGVPGYGSSTPGQRTQDGPVTDMQSEAALTPQNEPATR
jgi:hypothetical protein